MTNSDDGYFLLADMPYSIISIQLNICRKHKDSHYVITGGGYSYVYFHYIYH